MIKLGRNEPCHCGSGKKYKKCHLAADQAERDRQRREEQSSNPADELSEAFSLAKEGSLPAGANLSTDDPKLGGLSPQAKEILLEYVQRREEIERAGEALDGHWEEVESICADPGRFGEMVYELFSDPRFDALRFTADDVRRAFEKVGFASMETVDEESVNILVKAMLHVADEKRRMILGVGLLIHLPDFVASGRYLEACLLQILAFETMEKTEKTNAFLYHMFTSGYETFVAEGQAHQEAILEEFGLDPVEMKNMSPLEAKQKLVETFSDPLRNELAEKLFARDPIYREASLARLDELRDRCAELVDREDTPFLEFSREEALPWFERFSDAYEEWAKNPENTLTEDSPPDIVEEVLQPILRQMATSLFTPARIEQLVDDLTEFQNERFEAGDRESASLAEAAISWISPEDEPGLNPFLLTVCYRTIRSTIPEIEPEEP